MGVLPPSIAANVVARLKVLADLLTYRTDIPQEGRIRGGRAPAAGEVRVSTFPTLHGERAAIRLFAAPASGSAWPTSACPPTSATPWAAPRRHLGGDPAHRAGRDGQDDHDLCLPPRAGGQTRGGGRIATLEDPIEAAVDGVSQSQVNPAAGFDLATGLRSLLRQDPEVIAVGEIRDRAPPRSRSRRR